MVKEEAVLEEEPVVLEEEAEIEVILGVKIEYKEKEKKKKKKKIKKRIRFKGEEEEEEEVKALPKKKKKNIIAYVIKKLNAATVTILEYFAPKLVVANKIGNYIKEDALLGEIIF